MDRTPNRALLVIDVQNEYVDGALPIGWPDVQTALDHVGQAMDAAAARIPVIVVQQDGPGVPAPFAPGSHGWALHPVVAQRPCDLRIAKTLPSAFAGTTLAPWLVARGIDTLAIAGFMTQNCIASTVVDAMHRGFGVEFLHDAAGAVGYANGAGHADARQVHETFCVVFQARFAAVATTAEWIGALRDGGRLERDSIVASAGRARAGQAGVWTDEASIVTQAPAEAVWQQLQDVARWSEWNAGVASAELHGPFRTGTSFTMRLPEGSTLTSTLIDVQTAERFIDETLVDATRVVVRHELRPLAAGGCRIVYATRVTGPDAAAIGPQVTGDFPDVLQALKQRVEAKIAVPDARPDPAPGNERIDPHATT